MSKKIEINTLITKHENKRKGCRFDMIDVEDPLWEYGSPLKRVLIDNLTGETYDSVSKLVGLLNDLYEERNYFERKKCEYWNKFNLAHLDNINLQEENEQLKKEHKIAIDEMISDYKNLEKENEELKEDKKILDSIKKRHNCSNCVKTIENNNYCYCLKHYKEVTEDEICENYKYWR